MIEAFWRCLGKTSYDKLTVAQIVREAGLNRNSFYYHFEDIDSMSRSVVAEVLDRDFLRKAFALLLFLQEATLICVSRECALSRATAVLLPYRKCYAMP